MREVAVLDRIVDGKHAVLIVGDPPDREVAVPIETLPEGVQEGHWLRVILEGEHLVDAQIDQVATDAAKQRIHSKLEQLRRRGRRLGES
ncbi:DUF3006 domain-containing protein [Phycisphaerales bacterium AB-hyl4]|uniref:DUF3006 domain-containing protein n=1 Tax=Natronomicrosphaera hydrolytica TaxID=3242702 RepID=A0ABV4U8C8_9BACT